MIKIICDRCGKDIAGNTDNETAIGYIAWNFKDSPDGDLAQENIFEKSHYCRDCMEEVREFIRRKPQREDSGQQENTSLTDDAQEASQGTKMIRKRTKPEDVGKIIALRNAGWLVNDIANEMNMSQQAVSDAIWHHMKNTKTR